MNLPRLIIADEIQAGIVPPSLILIYALKRSGVKVKVFTCGRSDSDMRLLKLLLGEPIVSLDSFACGNIKNLKMLFQRVAKPDALNVILVPVGTRQDEDLIQVNPEVTDLAKIFSCGIVPVISASASAILTARTTTAVLSALEKACEGAVLGIIFASVKNPREYQILEQEYGRSTPVLSLGYIPKETERALPSMRDLYNNASGIMQVKSAALQLASASFNIEWEILDAFGQLKQEWVFPEALSFASKNFNVAIVGGQTLALEGDNCRELFTLLGCGVVDYEPLQDPFPYGVGAIYFPHSAVSIYGDRLLAHEAFLQGIKHSFTSNKLIFANGASVSLFGQSFTTVDGVKQDALGFFKFSCKYVAAKTKTGARRVEARGIDDSIFTKRDEKLRGYTLDYLDISNPGNVVPPVWGYRDVRKDTELGVSGWAAGYCFITDLYMELWSNIEVVNRWLALRKR